MYACVCGGEESITDPSVRGWVERNATATCGAGRGPWGPAWRPWAQAPPGRLARASAFGATEGRASTHGSRGLLAEGKCPRPIRPKGLFLPAVLVGYKSSLEQFAPTQIMRFAAIYRPFRDTRLRRRQPRDTTRAVPDARSPGRAGSARFGGFCPLPSLRGILVLGLPDVNSRAEPVSPPPPPFRPHLCLSQPGPWRRPGREAPASRGASREGESCGPRTSCPPAEAGRGVGPLEGSQAEAAQGLFGFLLSRGRRPAGEAPAPAVPLGCQKTNRACVLPVGWGGGGVHGEGIKPNFLETWCLQVCVGPLPHSRSCLAKWTHVCVWG